MFGFKTFFTNFKSLYPPIPDDFTLDPSSLCQLQCRTCPTGTNTIKLKKTSLTFSQFKSFLFKIKTPRVCHLYNWGEPLLNPHLIKIIRFLKGKKTIVDFDTNLSLKLTPQKLKSIITSGVDVIQISLDGASPATYNQYRRGGNFDLVFDNLRRLRQIQKDLKLPTPRLIWKFIVNKYNESEIETAQKMAKDIDVEIKFSKFGFADDIVDNNITPNVSFSANQKKWLPKNQQYVEDRYKSNYHPPEKCWWLFHSFIVHPDGHVLPCCVASTPKSSMGNLSKVNHIKKIWYSPKYLYARSLFLSHITVKRVPVICENCKLYKHKLNS